MLGHKTVPLFPPFLFQLMNSRLYRKVNQSGIHTDTLGTVLSTMTGCLKSLLKIILIQMLLYFGEGMIQCC